MGSWIEAFFTLLGYIDLTSAWRLWICALATGGVLTLISAAVHQPIAQFLLCVPLGVAGLGAGINWEFSREPRRR